MVHKIIKFPNPSLRKPCEWVSNLAAINDHVQDLKDTLAAHPEGVALASNQILPNGFRVFVVRPGTGLPEVLINPRWSIAPGSELWRPDEGCLSIPELRVQANRQSKVKLTWDDRDAGGSGEFEGFQAQIIQHECEHLNGGSLFDHAPHELQIRVRAEAIRNRKAGR